RVAETIKNIIKEQAINTGNEMENAGEALVWLVDYYKERM
ncbi:chromosome partitioning protein ParB, partial [Escherichia coli]